MEKTLDSALVYYLRTAYAPPQKVSESEVNIVPGAKIRPVRVGCIFSQLVGDERRFLLGRLQEDDGTEHQYRLKTAGGYLKLKPDGSWTDRNSIEGLKRELSEEGFRGFYGPVPTSFRPVAVYSSQAKGTLQFFSGVLNNYPPMGMSGEALFRRRKDHRVSIQYCTLENVIESAIVDKSIPFETSRAIAASYLFAPSRRIDVNNTSAVGHATKKGNLKFEEEHCKSLVAQAGLPNLPLDALSGCRVYYSRPKLQGLKRAEVDDTLKIVPALRLFFLFGPFVREIGLHPERLYELMGKRRPPLTYVPADVAGRFINKYFDRLVGSELLKPYLKSTELF
ncbi:hypothetical protein KY363_00620 [Candidatus Woesearchaeota archaeon]|nr:hypothetical protein [Candidatus Woesearchaeota archaeon]